MKDGKVLDFKVWNYVEGAPVNIVGMSGGKDSTATLLLMYEQKKPNLMGVFANTGNEHPMTYEFIERLREELPVPIYTIEHDFSRQLNTKADNIEAGKTWQDQPEEYKEKHVALLRKGTGNPFMDANMLHSTFPSRLGRWCTEELKIFPCEKQVYGPLMRAGFEVILHTGVRADESPNRRNLPPEDVADMGYRVTRPILTWTADEVFDYHKMHDIEPNPLYKLGMGRVGCMPCIMCNKRELAEIGKRFPDQIQRIRDWELFMKNGGGRFTTMKGKEIFPTFVGWKMVPERLQQKVKEEGIFGIIDWAKYGPNLVGIDEEDEEPAYCHSIYGLCE